MATLPVITVGDDVWALLGAAPLTFSVKDNDIQVCAAASLPAPTFEGHPYSPGTGETFSIGPNVYAKSNGGTARIIVTVA